MKLKHFDTEKNAKMARAEYTASVDFYDGVRKAEQEAAWVLRQNAKAEQSLREVMNVSQGRWMH